MDFDMSLPAFNSKGNSRKNSLLPSFNNKYISSSMEVVNNNRLQEFDRIIDDQRSDSHRHALNTPIIETSPK